MPDLPYTAEDLELVARALGHVQCDHAPAVLDALTAAGWVRLNPEADIEEFWGALVRYGDAEIVQATGDNRADAERFAANWDPPGRVVRQWAYQWCSPWEQVVAASPSTGEDRTDG